MPAADDVGELSFIMSLSSINRTSALHFSMSLIAILRLFPYCAIKSIGSGDDTLICSSVWNRELPLLRVTCDMLNIAAISLELLGILLIRQA